MNVKVSRNDLCPCGSGKKYKKCCGANEAVSITHMIESEIDDLQKQILHFAFSHYDDELYNDFEDLDQVITVEDEKQNEFFQFVHAIWFSLFWELDDEERIIDKFISSESKKIKRTKLREILHTWTKARTIAGKIVEINSNTLTVENGLTGERLDIVVADLQESPENGSFFVAIILPYGQKHVFFPAPFDLPDLDPEFAFDYIKQQSKEKGYDLPEDYLTDRFIEIMNELPMISQHVEIEDFEWPAPIYQEVAEIFQRRLTTLGVEKPVIDVGIVLWYQFCQKKQKRIQNPTVYVAALHYLLSMVVPMEHTFTQKELAELYSVSVGTMSSNYREIADLLETDIRKILGILHEEEPVHFNPPVSIESEQALQEALAELEGKDFNSLDEINVFMNKKLNAPSQKKVPKGKKEKARQLIYDAFQSNGRDRYQLAQQALDLDPNCVDAYVILAETATTQEEALKFYGRGVQAGEKELGKDFFEENKGYFWGLLETRPYMRAKFHYAETLYLTGNLKAATKQYEELLNLNPNDNQGVRYTLFAAYMDQGSYSKARRLLQQYKEGTAHGLYNLLLLELLEKGFTARATKLLKDAKKQNKYVIDYLTGKKRLPKTAPDYYGFGDENEAVIYADMHLHLWDKVDGLKEWLKGAVTR
jgi:tetratricopeptide (TPR) repeat protein